MTEEKLTLDLLRHGEPVGGRRFRGWQDDPLSEAGWEQMHAATDGHSPWSFILSSPLKRCRAFAEKLSSRTSTPLRIDEQIREIGFGDWEGLRVDELMAAQPDALKHHWADLIANTPPGGEPLHNFKSRIEKSWEVLIEANTTGHGLVVAHGGTIRVMICHALGLPIDKMWRIEVPYASLTRITFYRDEKNEPLPVLSFHAGQLS